MRKVISVRILYEISSRIEAAYISEFLKLCGVMITEQDVAEEEMTYEFLTQNFTAYDYNLLLGIQCIDFPDIFKEDCQKHSNSCSNFEHSSKFAIWFREKNFEQLNNYLYEIIEKVFDNTNKNSSLFALAELYVNREYCKKSFLKRFFSTNMDKETKQKFYEEFLKMTDDINQIKVEKEKEAEPYILFASAFCCKKVNELCDGLGRNFHFSLSRMTDKCLKVIQLAGKFPGAYVLAASFCACDRALYGSVLPFYYNAIKENESKPWTAGIYYRIGQYWEKKKTISDKANPVYEEALKVDPLYFKAIFKKGGELLEKKKYLQSIEYYKEILRILQNKHKANQLYPIEMEYLCKCYSMVGLIYDYYLEDSLKASKYYKNMIAAVNISLKESYYFKDFLNSKEKEEYIELLKERISKRSRHIIDKYRW